MYKILFSTRGKINVDRNAHKILAQSVIIEITKIEIIIFKALF